MDFRENLISALLTSNLSINAFTRTEIFLKFPFVPEKIADSLSHIQAYNAIVSSYPYYYEISKLNSFCLIYTENGSGLLTFGKRNYTLKQGTIALIDCRHWHRIEIKNSPWSYKVLFLSGPPVSFFYYSFIENSGNLYTLLLGSEVPDKINFMYDYLSKYPDKPLFHAKYINDILFELLIEKERLYDVTSSIQNCIYQIKHDFDYRYMDSISLELLERKYHISKYHICREFTKQFHISPIRYLKFRKIEMAKRILIQTDKRINEIGRLIGFENTNNFIRNFKKITGVTPLEYRKQFFQAENSYG